MTDMTPQQEDQSLELIVKMVRTAPPGATTTLVVGPFASTTWFLDAIVEAALIHLGPGGDVLVNRAARAVYAPEGRTFRIMSADTAAEALRGLASTVLFDPSAREASRTRWLT